MKKLRKLGTLLLTAALIGCLAGCGSSPAEDNGGGSDSSANVSQPAEIETVYIYGEAVENEMDDENYELYQLKLFTDGSYEMTKTEALHGYEMLLGATTVISMGTYESGEAVDGLIPCNLKAERIIYNSYSDMGGYNITIDTKDAVYPVELPGNKMTEEKGFKEMYGDITVYLIEDTNAFCLTDEW